MSFIKVNVHLIWTRYKRNPYLTENIRSDVFKHIRENLVKHGIYIDFINGYFEHIHCLVSLNADLGISKIVQLIKGESSFWINKNKLTQFKFAWQDEYLAVSVGDSELERVRNYIANQSLHHKTKSFQQEYDKFISHYGIQLKSIHRIN